MAKEKGLAERAGFPADESTQSMVAFLAEAGIQDDYGVGDRQTLNIWEPKEGEIRAIRYMGQESRTSTSGEFAGSEFDIHYGVDLKTGEDFSFVGGGLFSFTVKDKKIEKGTSLLVRYLGIIPIDDGRRQAKQWDIRKLEKK